MSLSRRGILGLLGGAIAAPQVGAKAAAETLGLPGMAVTSEPFPVEPFFGSGLGDSKHHWWGSIPQISLEASYEARHSERHRYDHMKSWGAAFRHSVTRRDIMLERMFQMKAERDEAFTDKLKAFLKL